MESLFSHDLLLHGTIVLMCGLLSGVPFWLTIITRRGEAEIRAWRVAHTTLIATGLTMMVVSRLTVSLSLSEAQTLLAIRALIAAGYGFVVALVAGAATGFRALTPKLPVVNFVLFLGHMIGAVGSILGIGLILYGLI